MVVVAGTLVVVCSVVVVVCPNAKGATAAQANPIMSFFMLFPFVCLSLLRLSLRGKLFDSDLEGTASRNGGTELQHCGNGVAVLAEVRFIADDDRCRGPQGGSRAGRSCKRPCRRNSLPGKADVHPEMRTRFGRRETSP